MRTALAALLVVLTSCPGPQPPAGGPPPPPPPAAPDAGAPPPPPPDAAPPPPDAGPPPLAADGAACTAAADCDSGICEGEGCGAGGGVCAAKSRACTKDLRPYCGCDGVTFRTSGSCPGRRFAFRGACADKPAGKAADGAACSVAVDCQSGVCEGQGCGDRNGRCVSRQRPCTMDYRAYCGCDGKTFHGSGSCPNQRFAARGECKGAAAGPGLGPVAEARLVVNAVLGSHADVNRQVETLLKSPADAIMADCRRSGITTRAFVTVAFVVQGDGKVTNVTIANQHGPAALASCLNRWAGGLKFQPPTDPAGKATAQMTLRFDPP